jgi:hypothetical protein
MLGGEGVEQKSVSGDGQRLGASVISPATGSWTRASTVTTAK